MPAIVKTRQLAASSTTNRFSSTSQSTTTEDAKSAAQDARSASERADAWNRAHPPPPHRLKLPWAPHDPIGTLVDPSHEPANFFTDLGKAILIGDTRGDRLGTWVAEDNRLLIFDRPPHAKPYGIPVEPTIIRPEHRVEIPVYSPWQGLIANNGGFSTCRLMFHLHPLTSYADGDELREKIVLDSIFIGGHEQLEEPIPISKIGPRTLVNFYSGAPRSCTFVNRSRHKIEIQTMILGQLGGPSHTRPNWWTD
jgi:hypothetical protein